MSYQAIDKQDLERFAKDAAAGGRCVISITPGASNVATFTVQYADAGVKVFDMYMSTLASGANLTGTAYSTGLAVTTGTTVATNVANKSLLIMTDATGKAVITLTATAKPVGEYMCVVGPSGGINMSAATVTGSYG